MMVETSIFAPHVEKHVEYVMKKPPIGLCQKRIMFLNPRPSCPAYHPDAKADHFKMIIPFAGVPVELFVMFQATQPSCPPDFIFADSRILIPLDEMSVLRNWNVHRPSAFRETLKQLMRYFKLRHIRLLEHHVAVYAHYASLVSSGKYTEEDVEIYVPSTKNIPISFLIRVRPNFKKIPSAYFSSDEARKYPLMFVSFYPHDKGTYTKRLYYSKELQTALNLPHSYRFSAYASSVPLGQYIRVIENDLNKKAEILVSGYEIRKSYVAMFVSRLENAIVEYDALLFKKLCFMIEDGGYQVLVEISIQAVYPLTIPIVTFKSLYHTYQGVPTAVIANSYPFSPDWPVEQMYEQTVRYIYEYATDFPQDSLPYQ